MAKIIPFKGLRPKKQYAPEVATLPYDVVSVAEVRRFKKDVNNFYHITRSEIDFAENIDVHSQQVYDKAKENLDCMVSEKIMIQDDEPCYYIYQLVMNGRSQTGLVCCSSCDDYFKGIIKKHEFTRPEKELDRINHMRATRAQTGVVFLAYRDNREADKMIEDWKAANEPAYDFLAEDGVRHTFWVMDDYSKVATISRIFEEDVPCTYIADGHHRAASAGKVCMEMRENGMYITGDESFNYFLTCIFPESQLVIMDYNRVVKDLNELSDNQFLEQLRNVFTVTKTEGSEAYKPQKPHEFGMYHSGSWYKLTAKEGTFTTDPIGVLDVTILQEKVLSQILNINDPRTDKRIDFIGGIRGLDELKKRVDSGEFAAAFAMYPVTIEQLFNIADSGSVMPPKSTWFEPKLRDGLVVHLI